MRQIALLFSCVFCSCLIYYVNANGALSDPPSRGIMWKYGFEGVLKNSDYHTQANCGGYAALVAAKGKCGVCGDPYDASPQDHAYDGKYGFKKISRYYPEGVKVINVAVELWNDQGGYFVFKLCPTNGKRVTQKCLDTTTLPIKEGYLKGTAMRFYPEGTGVYHLTVAIPETITRCDRCVLQWTYHTADSWGIAANGTGCTGCGLQMEFKNCADIQIGGAIPSYLENFKYKQIAGDLPPENRTGIDVVAGATSIKVITDRSIGKVSRSSKVDMSAGVKALDFGGDGLVSDGGTFKTVSVKRIRTSEPSSISSVDFRQGIGGSDSDGHIKVHSKTRMSTGLQNVEFGGEGTFIGGGSVEGMPVKQKKTSSMSGMVAIDFGTSNDLGSLESIPASSKTHTSSGLSSVKFGETSQSDVGFRDSASMSTNKKSAPELGSVNIRERGLFTDLGSLDIVSKKTKVVSSSDIGSVNFGETGMPNDLGAMASSSASSNTHKSSGLSSVNFGETSPSDAGLLDSASMSTNRKSASGLVPVGFRERGLSSLGSFERASKKTNVDSSSGMGSVDFGGISGDHSSLDSVAMSPKRETSSGINSVKFGTENLNIGGFDTINSNMLSSETMIDKVSSSSSGNKNLLPIAGSTPKGRFIASSRKESKTIFTGGERPMNDRLVQTNIIADKGIGGSIGPKSGEAHVTVNFKTSGQVDKKALNAGLRKVENTLKGVLAKLQDSTISTSGVISQLAGKTSSFESKTKDLLGTDNNEMSMNMIERGSIFKSAPVKITGSTKIDSVGPTKTTPLESRFKVLGSAKTGAGSMNAGKLSGSLDVSASGLSSVEFSGESTKLASIPTGFSSTEFGGIHTDSHIESAETGSRKAGTTLSGSSEIAASGLSGVDFSSADRNIIQTTKGSRKAGTISLGTVKKLSDSMSVESSGLSATDFGSPNSNVMPSTDPLDFGSGSVAAVGTVSKKHSRSFSTSDTDVGSSGSTSRGAPAIKMVDPNSIPKHNALDFGKTSKTTTSGGGQTTTVTEIVRTRTRPIVPRGVPASLPNIVSRMPSAEGGVDLVTEINSFDMNSIPSASVPDPADITVSVEEIQRMMERERAGATGSSERARGTERVVIRKETSSRSDGAILGTPRSSASPTVRETTRTTTVSRTRPPLEGTPGGFGTEMSSGGRFVRVGGGPTILGPPGSGRIFRPPPGAPGSGFIRDSRTGMLVAVRRGGTVGRLMPLGTDVIGTSDTGPVRMPTIFRLRGRPGDPSGIRPDTLRRTAATTIERQITESGVRTPTSSGPAPRTDRRLPPGGRTSGGGVGMTGRFASGRPGAPPAFLRPGPIRIPGGDRSPAVFIPGIGFVPGPAIGPGSFGGPGASFGTLGGFRTVPGGATTTTLERTGATTGGSGEFMATSERRGVSAESTAESTGGSTSESRRPSGRPLEGPRGVPTGGSADGSFFLPGPIGGPLLFDGPGGPGGPGGPPGIFVPRSRSTRGRIPMTPAGTPFIFGSGGAAEAFRAGAGSGPAGPGVSGVGPSIDAGSGGVLPGGGTGTASEESRMLIGSASGLHTRPSGGVPVALGSGSGEGGRIITIGAGTGSTAPGTAESSIEGPVLRVTGSTSGGPPPFRPVGGPPGGPTGGPPGGPPMGPTPIGPGTAGAGDGSLGFSTAGGPGGPGGPPGPPIGVGGGFPSPPLGPPPSPFFGGPPPFRGTDFPGGFDTGPFRPPSGPGPFFGGPPFFRPGLPM